MSDVRVWVVSRGADIVGVYSTEAQALAYVEGRRDSGLYFIEAMWVDGEVAA